MPLPTPSSGETQDDFISRCIPATIDDQDLDPESEADREQASAICYSQWSSPQGNENDVAENAAVEMRFACNVTTGVRTEQRDGRQWLVAPVVALASGVRNGELVTQDAILDHPQTWNGRPIVVYHPQDEEGHPISANSPEVLERQQIGQFFNVNAHANGVAKLKGEMWIDIRKAERIGGEAAEVLRRLRNDEPLEVSTAYFRDVIQRSGSLNGKTYETVAQNLRPDHLAALPNQVGACSWEDGCGAPRINKRKEPRMTELQANVLSEARTPEYGGTTSNEWSAPDWDTIYDAYYTNNPDAEQPDDVDGTPDVSDAPAAVRSFAAGLSLLGDPDAESFEDLVYFPVVEPGTKNLNENALDAVIGGRSAQADAPADAVESARRVAYRLLQDEFDRDVEFEPLSQNQDEGEDEMDELIERIVDDGRLGLNAEDLADREEAELRGMIAVLEAMPAEDPDPVEDDGTEGEEPTVNDEEEPTVNEQQATPEIDPRLTELLEAVDEVGGVQALSRVVRDYQASAEQRRNQMIATLSANEACPFNEEQLGRMDDDQLISLQQGLAPVDYTGMGVNNGTPQGEQELAMPQVNWGTD